MSRRGSTLSLNDRQNDTLGAFENFKKKCLLANTHITKLNSTLSIRIEELNAQISMLHVENLRLRASEIKLAAQLKKERDKSRKVMADTEAATHKLAKHLVFLRDSLHIPHGPTSPAPESAPTQHTASRPHPVTCGSLTMPRISRPPNVPGIYEEDEGGEGEEGAGAEDDEPRIPSPTVRRKANKNRLSASRLPLPARTSTPTDLVPMEEKKTVKKKSSKRQSGAGGNVSGLPDGDEVLVPHRTSTPIQGSTTAVYRDVPMEIEEEDARAVDHVVASSTSRKEKDREKEKEKERKKRPSSRSSEENAYSTVDESESGKSSVPTSRENENEKKRKRDETRDYEITTETTAVTLKLRLKDVTNSPRSLSRAQLPPIDTTDLDRHHTHARTHSAPASSEVEQPTPLSTTSASTATSASTTRTFLSNTAFSTPATTPAPSCLPTPRTSTPPPLFPAEETPAGGGRERRTRKSVNYAEPKLNTKMRKPDPPPGSAPVPQGGKKRVSSPPFFPASATSSTGAPSDDVDMDSTPRPRRRSRDDVQSVHDEDAEDLIAEDHNDNGDDDDYLPPSSHSRRTFPSPSSSSSSKHLSAAETPTPRSSASPSSSSSVTVQRKKSRSRVSSAVNRSESESENDSGSDSAGTQGDAEYGGLIAASGGSWVNTEGRRRAIAAHSKRATATATGGSKLLDGGDLGGRRHSMAV